MALYAGWPSVRPVSTTHECRGHPSYMPSIRACHKCLLVLPIPQDVNVLLAALRATVIRQFFSIAPLGCQEICYELFIGLRVEMMHPEVVSLVDRVGKLVRYDRG